MSSVETVDFGGMGEAQVVSYIKEKFENPLQGSEPVRYTFIVGAGKLGRQKYNPELLKYTVSALRAIGFEEDRSASACIECMGTFKSQHDTDKNLKFIHVFPRVHIVSEEVTTSAEELNSESVDFLCASCELATFKDMVAEKITSWSQKKNLSTILQEYVERFRDIEQKIISLQIISPAEQKIYDSLSSDILLEKVQWLSGQLKSMADEGKLSKVEKNKVLNQIKKRLDTLEKGPKNETQRKALMERLNSIALMEPISRPLLKENEIIAVLRKLNTIERIEAIKDRLLTITEVKTVGEKDEYQEKYMALINESKGWFEDEEEFIERVNDLKTRVKGPEKKNSVSNQSTNKKNGDTWETVGKAKEPSRGRRK